MVECVEADIDSYDQSDMWVSEPRPLPNESAHPTQPAPPPLHHPPEAEEDFRLSAPSLIAVSIHSFICL